jgi:pre-mRNA-splicing factor CWC22
MSYPASTQTPLSSSQELSEHLGLRQLNARLTDPLHTADVEGIFPRDTPKNTRFSINFFTSIGLGGLTDGLREHLKNMPKQIMQQQPPQV